MSEQRDPGDKPREMVYRAMADAKHQLHQAGRVWTGAIGADRPERARKKVRRELHAAAMSYLDQIRRFEGKNEVEEVWCEDVAGLDASLAELAEQRFSTVTVREQEYNESSNRTRAVNRQRPWLLTIPQADAVINQLDACALALGFDDNPRRNANQTGAGLNNAPESAEEMDHINTEVPVDGD